MQFNKPLNKILSQDGVYDVCVLDDAAYIRVELEESKNTGMGCKYENRALSEGRSSDLKLAVFSESFLEAPTEMMTIMTDDTGEIYGHDVPKGMSRNKIRDGGMWVSSTYVMYPDIIPKSELRIVVVPHGLSIIGENEGVKDVIAFNPSPTTDQFLKGHFDFDGPKNCMTTIVTMNYLE